MLFVLLKTLFSDKWSKLRGIPGQKKKKYWEIKLHHRTAVLDFQEPPRHSTSSDKTRPPKGNVFLISSLSKQDTALSVQLLAVAFSSSLSSRVFIIRGSGRQEELQWPSADRILDSKRDRFLLDSPSLKKCACAGTPTWAQWDYFCWLSRSSSRKSCCGFYVLKCTFCSWKCFHWFGNFETWMNGVSLPFLLCHPALAISWPTKCVSTSHSSWSVLTAADAL